MTKNSEHIKKNFDTHGADVVAKIISDYALEDYVEVKEVDRRLSYFLAASSSVVCDVGGATGVDAVQLAMRGALCVCLDIDKVAIKHGKHLSKRRGPDIKLEYIVASALNMPFKDSSFDLVTCFSVLDHLPNKTLVYLAVREFSRIVKNQGHVTITIPNKLFIIGTLSMRLKQLLDTDIFEQRFTPQELIKIIILSGLKPLIMDSKYPTKVGVTILESNFPKIVRAIPESVYKPVFLVAERIFKELEKKAWLKLFGARLGYLSQKKA